MSSALTTMLILAFVALAAADLLYCPFKHYEHKLRNCERSSHFMKYLEEHPAHKNRRPDMRPENASYYDYESLKYCCYEIECLLKCGHSDSSLYNNDISQHVREDIGKYFRIYPEFFVNVDEKEFYNLQFAHNDSKLMEFWKIRAAHLYNRRPYLDRHRERLNKQ